MSVNKGPIIAHFIVRSHVDSMEMRETMDWNSF